MTTEDGRAESAKTREVLGVLWGEKPKFHGAAEDAQNWKLRRGILDYLQDTVEQGHCTLETGCGYSTVIFAASGARHIAISPFDVEHQRIRDWLVAHDVGIEGLRFVAEPSQKVLPELEAPPLDLVLIDGDHAFPVPFFDWYYTADMLKVGGRVVVDDTNIMTGAILRDFLAADRERWALKTEFKRTAVFEKLVPTVAAGIICSDQPYCARKIRFPRLERALRPLWRRLMRRRGD